MHVLKHLQRLAKHMAANMAQILQVSTRCRVPKPTQPQCTTDAPTSAAGTQNIEQSLDPSQIEIPDEHSIDQAYHLASIANARLRKEAERHDHDLRLLVGHANLLDQLTEKIEQVEPDFTIESLDPVVLVLPSHGMRLPKTLRRNRIDEIMRKIDLSDDEDDEELDDEVYDESDDDDDDIEEPVTPDKESFPPTGSGDVPWYERDMPAKVELPLQQDPLRQAGRPIWSDLAIHRRVVRKDPMPIISVTFLDGGV